MRAREVDPEAEAWERRQWDPAAGDVIVFADFADLSTEKLEIIERTLRAILYSPVAEETFAQIVDAKPTRPSFFRNYGGREFMSNSNVSDLERPREEAIRFFHEIRANFSLLSLKIDAKVRQSSLHLEKCLGVLAVIHRVSFLYLPTMSLQYVVILSSTRLMFIR